ncbi:MAG: flagellar biosynthesis protein FlhA [Planctomycetota bacterium]|nr:MAG: flagellar biosynthesis protein FlhA [Planctomycetota bacterium]
MSSQSLPSLGGSDALRQRGQLALIMGMVGILAVLIIPLPTFVLDLLITVNVTVSILIMMATISARSPLQLSTFPSILLFTALMRLSLNVASTRLILLQGEAGTVIQAFGDFVVGGNFAVGIVIFAVLIIIQFAVITKGQNRIAEVAARFTLDAMPGKQMAIDADLNAGIISNEEAKQRRADISREAEFYGAMDGAGKFVRGDAVAGILITAINIIGGILIGTLMRDMAAADAMAKYTVLTVGDGLVSQIPGLVIAVSSGILTTKAASKNDLAEEMTDQVLGTKSTVRMAGFVMLGLGLVPGLPTIPFMILGGALLIGSSRAESDTSTEASKEGDESVEAEEDDEEKRIENLLHVDRLGIEIGYRLISIVDPGRHGGLLEHISALRRQFVSQLGLVVPPIRVKDNIQLGPNNYRILLMGQEIATGEVHAGQYLAMDPTGSAPPIEGKETIEPAFGLPARWISEGQKEHAEMIGYTVIEAPSVLVTHLTEVLRSVCSELLSREDVQALLENSKKIAPTVVDEVVPSILSSSQVQRVLADLLKERVSIRNLPLILESLGDAAAESKEHRHLVENVRTRISRAILEPYIDEQGALHVATIEPQLEQQLLAALTGQGTQGEVLAQGALGSFVERSAEVLADLVRQGHQPVLVTRAALRPFLAEAVVGAVPGSAVLSYQEIAVHKEIDVIAQVNLQEATV